MAIWIRLLGHGDVEAAEKLAFYGHDATKYLLKQALFTAGVIDDSGNLTGINLRTNTSANDLFKQAVESAYDGTSVLNSKFYNSMKKALSAEKRQLLGLPEAQKNHPQIQARISELTSQLSNLEGSGFQGITSRIFLPFGGRPVMFKSVTDQSGFAKELQKYAGVLTDVVMKKEPGIMGATETVNMVLQGEPMQRVYYDPLAPAFHYDIFSSETYKKAQQSRQARILQAFQNSVESGQIDSTLKRSILNASEQGFDALPPAMRNIRERNRLYMRELKAAIESGIDIRNTPRLLNYLENYVKAELYREKDDVFQPVMDNVFRLAIDTESSFYSMHSSERGLDRGPILGEGVRNVSMRTSTGSAALEAMEFQVQGHKMLFGGNAAQIFKHSLGGFDLDDHGIVMPKIFTDASGNERLGTFMFRQPTGPGEFIFSMPRFGNTDTINLFLRNSDAIMNQLELAKDEDSIFREMYEATTATRFSKTRIK